ncbi:hypothetical protein [uncultured Methanobrevibacter sp.]|uniref:hypothetical protein n=1 Tax=uncultured Methanobrevibacter sp. TaxID=253161 RepID=UPI0025E0CA04|nr:hypothetical protein [uncultured Methanobrevibacter sp.]
MNILIISQYILVLALLFMMIVALRLAAREGISNALIGCSVINLVLAMLLIVMGNIFSIEFCKDIAFPLIFIGVVGTIAYAIVLRRT